MNRSPVPEAERRTRQLLPLVILTLALIAAVLSAIAFATQFDAPNSNYFQRGAILPTVACSFSVIAVLTAVLSLVCLFPKNSFSAETMPMPRAAIPSAIGFLLCAIFLSLGIVQNGESTMRVVALALALISIGYECLVPFADLNRKTVRDRAVPLGFAPIFCLIFLCAILYFDRSIEMNAPLKVYLTLGLLTALLSCTNELRFLLGSAMPRLCFLLLSCTVATGALTIFAIPTALCVGIAVRADYLAAVCAVWGCTLSAGLRLYALAQSKPQSASTLPTAQTNTEEDLDL